MCTVLLPPGVNQIAVSKYININYYQLIDEDDFRDPSIMKRKRREIVIQSSFSIFVFFLCFMHRAS